MTRTFALTLLAGVLLVAGACGSATSDSGSAPASPDPCAGVTPPPPSPGTQAFGPDAAATLTDTDRGAALSLHHCQVLTVFLHAPTALQTDRWFPVAASDNGAVLERESTGVMTLPIGVTAAIFKAIAPGHSTLSAARPPCGQASAGCDPALTWSASVNVVD
ncbi:MAG: hypothetical protein ACYDAY_09630 [Candidatus Dormibacteria bacterium]